MLYLFKIKMYIGRKLFPCELALFTNFDKGHMVEEEKKNGNYYYVAWVSLPRCMVIISMLHGSSSHVT